MVGIRRGPEPEASNQGARHRLYVEGSRSSIDFQALDFFFREKEIDIRVEPTGSASSIRAAAAVLHPSHRNYYFLIDRDHRDDEEVEKSWRNFPDENRDNCLIWRRREIENYFLIPEYLARSPYCTCSPEELRQCIRETASKRVFLDITNSVISELRNELDKVWIERFKDNETNEFREKDKAFAKLMEKYEAAKQTCNVVEELSAYPISKHFTETAKEFFHGEDGKREFDGDEELEFGRGSWLKLIRGKHVLPTVINYKNKYFRVQNAEDKYLQGPERLIEVVKSLLKLPLEDQPNDFQELHKLISTRVLKRSRL